MEEKEIGLYVHIPFCKSKCLYCDFVSFANNNDMIERYIECVKKEIIQYATENKTMSEHGLEPKFIVKTIYIGGGTPSYIDEDYIVQIMETIKHNFEVKEDAEITIEVNPGTASKDKLEAYKKCGINRLSIGLQSTQNKILKNIGRIHTYEEFIITYAHAREAKFKNINVDLMINLPGQTLDDVKDSIKRIINLKPEHISVYSLIVEDNTPIKTLLEMHCLELASDEVERQMYWYVKETLEKHKYHQYEISNFAKEGHESKHNMDCWNQKEYIGVGLNASSFLDNKRYSNISALEQYITNIEQNEMNKNLILEETLNEESKMNEYMMLGLRKIAGVNIQEFKNTFNVNPIVRFCKPLEKLTKEGLVQIDENSIKLTNKGIDLANLVWEEFV